MQDIIREFAKNDHIKSEYTEFGWQECDYYQFDIEELEKFSKRIIDECIRVVHHNTHDSSGIVLAIEIRFGIS